MEKFALFILIPLIIIIMGVCFYIYEQGKKIKIINEKKGIEVKNQFGLPKIKIFDIFKLVGKIILFLISAACLVVILFLIYVGIMKFKEYLDERGDRKAICAERIESVENDVAAKKLFEACMDR